MPSKLSRIVKVFGGVTQISSSSYGTYTIQLSSSNSADTEDRLYSASITTGYVTDDTPLWAYAESGASIYGRLVTGLASGYYDIRFIIEQASDSNVMIPDR